WVEPIHETNRWEAPALVNDAEADLQVRAWRWSYNARGIIEMPNHLRARQTALIMVHPWGIDDGQGWDTPEPAGVADFCTPAKNHLAAKHTRGVIVRSINRCAAKSPPSSTVCRDGATRSAARPTARWTTIPTRRSA